MSGRGRKSSFFPICVTHCESGVYLQVIQRSWRMRGQSRWGLKGSGGGRGQLFQICHYRLEICGWASGPPPCTVTHSPWPTQFSIEQIPRSFSEKVSHLMWESICHRLPISVKESRVHKRIRSSCATSNVRMARSCSTGTCTTSVCQDWFYQVFTSYLRLGVLPFVRQKVRKVLWASMSLSSELFTLGH